MTILLALFLCLPVYLVPRGALNQTLVSSCVLRVQPGTWQRAGALSCELSGGKKKYWMVEQQGEGK